jgi:Bacterial PH domain
MPRDYRDEPDITIEAVPGLPEALPRGEAVLWQGRPRPLALARSALSLTWVAGYFALLAVWRVGSLAVEMGWAGALPYAVPFLLLGLVACGLLYAIARVQARATVYTITTARVAMRIGAALTMTVNLPFGRLAGADLGREPGGTGTIALSTVDEARLSYAVLWPHVRPWRMRRVEPALRCVAEPEKVARLLADAVELKRTEPVLTTGPDAPDRKVPRRAATRGAAAGAAPFEPDADAPQGAGHRAAPRGAATAAK